MNEVERLAEEGRLTCLKRGIPMNEKLKATFLSLLFIGITSYLILVIGQKVVYDSQAALAQCQALHNGTCILNSVALVT